MGILLFIDKIIMMSPAIFRGHSLPVRIGQHGRKRDAKGGRRFPGVAVALRLGLAQPVVMNHAMRRFVVIRFRNEAL